MRNFKKELRNYDSLIKKNLTCSSNMKSVFIKDFNERVYDFINENPSYTIENIIENFGTPKEIAKSFDKDNDYYKRKARNRLIAEIILLLLLIFCIAISSYFICKILNDLGGETIITTY